MLALLLFFASIVVLGGAAIAALLRFSQAGAGGGAQVRETQREAQTRESIGRTRALSLSQPHLPSNTHTHTSRRLLLHHHPRTAAA